jgi:hypothetical protein
MSNSYTPSAHVAVRFMSIQRTRKLSLFLEQLPLACAWFSPTNAGAGSGGIGKHGGPVIYITEYDIGLGNAEIGNGGGARGRRGN